MIKDCKKAGNPPPKYEEIGGSFAITLPLRKTIMTVMPTRTPEPQLTDRQKEIVEILKGGPMSRKQIMSKLSTSIEARTMQRELSKLRELGLSISQGTGKFLLIKTL
jgi:predicted HTH transcriptional regulator